MSVAIQTITSRSRSHNDELGSENGFAIFNFYKNRENMPRPNFVNEKLNIAAMIRVDHAGEYGAKRIYEGQIKFANKIQDARLYAIMLDQEQKHLDYFNYELIARRVRPTILMPFWHLGGYILGMLSSIAGPKFAMLVTQGVEEVIEEHYRQQLIELKNQDNYSIDENNLISHIEQFMFDEVEHKEIAVTFQQKFPANSEHIEYNQIISNMIKKICMLAIYLSKKI